MAIAVAHRNQAPYQFQEIGSIERFSIEHPNLTYAVKRVANLAINILIASGLVFLSFSTPYLWVMLHSTLNFGTACISFVNHARRPIVYDFGTSLSEKRRQLRVLNFTYNANAAMLNINRLFFISRVAIYLITGLFVNALLETALFFWFERQLARKVQLLNDALFSPAIQFVSRRINHSIQKPASDPFDRLFKIAIKERSQEILQIPKNSFRLTLLQMISRRDQNRGGFERLLRKINGEIINRLNEDHPNSFSVSEISKRQRQARKILSKLSNEECETLYRIYLRDLNPQHAFQTFCDQNLPDIDVPPILESREQQPVANYDNYDFLHRHIVL
ncbi:MAG: hypothetical protein WD595_05330 [Waddliaceae bacterium]